MEQNFQTSFIPKKPMIEERTVKARPVNFFTVISIIVLFTMLISAGGVYFYRGVVNKSIASKQNTLLLAQSRFEPARIEQLQTLDKRLKASTDILQKHIAVSPIFEILEDITMKTVRYTEFSYEQGGDKDIKVVISMSGEAVGYRSIALQSELFGRESRLIDPVFSNLTLNNNGNVIFDLQFSVAPSLVQYQEMIKQPGLPANTGGN